MATVWPDLAVAAVMAAIFLTSSVQTLGRLGQNIVWNCISPRSESCRMSGLRQLSEPA